MKKRIFALALALMLALSLLPMAALATDDEPVPEPTESTEEIIQEPVAESDAEPAAESTPEPTAQPVVLEGASGETSEATNEPSVQSVDELQVALEGGTGDQGSIAYVDPTDKDNSNKKCDIYSMVNSADTSGSVAWSSGWYVVQGTVTIEVSVGITGDVYLILCDDAQLTVKNSIAASSGSLTIYGQTEGSGKLIVTGVSNTFNGQYAESSGIKVTNLTVNGGTITATGGSVKATDEASTYGIKATNVTVNGGTLTATGGSAESKEGLAESYGIRADDNPTKNGGTITVTGGMLTATGGTACSTKDWTECCAYSYGVSAKNLTVTGGTVKGTGGDTGSSNKRSQRAWSLGIYLRQGDNGKLTVSGGSVTGTGGSAVTGWMLAESYGIYVPVFEATGGEVKGTADTVTAFNGGYWTYVAACSTGIYVGKGDMAVSGSTVTANGGNVKNKQIIDENSYAQSYAIRVNGNMTVNKGSVTATGGSSETDLTTHAESYGIYVTGDMTASNASTVDVTGGTATANSSYDGQLMRYGVDAKSHGISAGGLYVNHGCTVTATGGTATTNGTVNKSGRGSTAESCGVCTNNSTIAGGTLAAIAGDATGRTARSHGIRLGKDMTVNADGTVTATAGDAHGTILAESGGLYAANIETSGQITAQSGAVNATESDTKTSCLGIAVKDKLTVSGGTLTATAEDTEEGYDIVLSAYFNAVMTLSDGTVRSEREDGAVRTYADNLEVSGGTITLAEDSILCAAKVSNGVALADLLADGYAYCKLKTVWDDKLEDNVYTNPSFVATEGLTELKFDYDAENGSWWSEYHVKPCTHSTDGGKCEYCGTTVISAAPAATPTAAPTAKPAHSPQTGDEANVTLWLALAAMSAMGIALVARKKAR